MASFPTFRKLYAALLYRGTPYVLVALLIWFAVPGLAVAQPSLAARAQANTFTSGSAPSSSAAQLPWLEANGLNVLDLVGFVPDQYLRGAILTSYSGIVVYESGSRSGNQVTVRTRIYPRVLINYNPNFTMTLVNCMAQPSLFDEWDSPMPPSRMKLYTGGTDITAELQLDQIALGGQVWPVRNTSQPKMSRYELVQPALTFSQGWAVLPANRGCQLHLSRQIDNLEAEWVFSVTPSVKVTVVGSQAFAAHSYIGVGEIGWLNPLMRQMRGRFPDRHEKFSLSVPSGADYIFVNFPPMQADPYTCPGNEAWGALNVARPSGGTYRLISDSGELSTDHVGAMGLPLGGQWLDADLSGGSNYLPYFQNVAVLSSPEYILPSSVPYQACMWNGTCPSSLLDQIYAGTTPMEVVYLRVERTSTNLVRVPLRQVGPSWQSTSASTAVVAPQASGQGVLTHRIYLPGVHTGFPPEDRSGCPCGWFDANGRMLDFTPR